jgi:hypothetical protein
MTTTETIAGYYATLFPHSVTCYSCAMDDLTNRPTWSHTDFNKYYVEITADCAGLHCTTCGAEVHSE